MVEIYLFVNPLGGVCLEIEKKLYNCLLTTRKNTIALYSFIKHENDQ